MLRYDTVPKLIDSLAGSLLCSMLGKWDALLRRNGGTVGTSGPLSRILISKMGNIGDTVLMVPAVKALRHSFPNAHISFIVTSHNVEIARMIPGIDELIFLDPVRCFANPLQFLRFIRRLRSGGYQVALDFDQWQHLPPIYLYLARIPVRIGFDTKGEHRGGLFSTRVPYTEDENDTGHEVDYFGRLVQALGVPLPDTAPELIIDDEDERAALALLERHGVPAGRPIVIVYPGGKQKKGVTRRWGDDRFAELCNHIAAEHQCPLLFVGGPEERQLADSIAQRVRPKPLVVNGDVSLGQLAALLKRASLFVGNVAGPMYIASAVGVPCVSLYGPTSASRWGAHGKGHVAIKSNVPCSPCHFLGGKRRKCLWEGACMESIAVSTVEDAVDRKLSQTLRERVGAGRV